MSEFAPPTLNQLAAAGDLAGVERLLAEGASVDAIDNGRFNETPLMLAAREGHAEIVARLLAAGANVNHVDNDGFSAVTAAARAGHWAIVKQLAECGGDFNVRDGHGKTGREYVMRCRGERNRKAIEAILAGRRTG